VVQRVDLVVARAIEPRLRVSHFNRICHARFIAPARLGYFLFGEAHAAPSRSEVLARLRPYVERELSAGARLRHIARHLLGLYRGQPGARAFRRLLSERAHAPDADWAVIEQALALAENAAAAHA